MYCKKCWAKIDDSSSYCFKCGALVSDSDITIKRMPMIFGMLLNFIVLITPFLKTFYISTVNLQSLSVEYIDFSSLGAYYDISNFWRECKEYLTYINSFISLSSSDSEQINQLKNYVFAVVAFDILLYIIGFAEIFFVIKNFRKQQIRCVGKFWKAIISSVFAIFFGNTIVFGCICYVNATIKGFIADYTNINENLMGGNALFFIVQAFVVVTYIWAYKQYFIWKRLYKEIKKREKYHERPDSPDLSSIGTIRSHGNEEISGAWRCKRCGKKNTDEVLICKCGTLRSCEK